MVGQILKTNAFHHPFTKPNWLVIFAFVSTFVTFILSSPGYADQKTAKDGMFVSVESPITGDTVQRVKLQIEDAIVRQKRNIRTVVFDFCPNDQPVQTTLPGSCIDFKNLIVDLQLGRLFPQHGSIATVAFIKNKISQHTILPALACSQIVMGQDGAIGKVEADDEVTRLVYLSTGKSLRCPDIVKRILQPSLTIQKVQTRKGTDFLAPDSLREAQKNNDVVEVMGVPKGLEPGIPIITAPVARDIGLCQGIYANRKSLAEALSLPLRSLRENKIVQGTTVAWTVEVNGTINASKVESLRRRIRDIIRQRGNLIFLVLNCEGGDASVAAPFVEDLRHWQDPERENPVRIVAYIPEGKSLGAATFLAMGCNEIIMASNAVMGDFAYLAESPELKQIEEALVSAAKENGYPEGLLKATLNQDVILHFCQSRTNPDNLRLMTDEELLGEKGNWKSVSTITPNKAGLITIDANLAKKADLVLQNDVNSVNELYKRFQLKQSDVNVSGDHWLDKIAEFFREPIIQVLLILLGITGLILEIKMPGFGIPGIIAGLCFVLFFWSHSFVGQFTMLAILLFILGLVLLAVEIFIIPGFGVTGISGILLVVVSLALVTLEKMPETSEDWLSLATTLTTFTFSLLGSIVIAIAIAAFLPHIPYANRLMLPPPGEGDDVNDDSEAVDTESLAKLLGAIGIAETPLRPAGKARFGDDYLDVVSEAEYITPGNRVQIIEIEGNRIVVKQV